ncbi:MAG: alpha/beta hydrolase-fold protein, partial [bacterium]|nr:alpha/beta hydrolase-fold protein [bacterium]
MPLFYSHSCTSFFAHFSWLLLLAAIPCNLLPAQDTAHDTPLGSSEAVEPGIVPQGKVTSGEFASSEIFPGTTREYSVYVPAQYRPEEPAKLMVFMDGKNYANPKGPFRVPSVFDNLIHRGEMPVTIAVFVNPGTVQATRQGAQSRSNRSFEYDSLGDRYARFLVDEFLPVALQGLNVSRQPEDRGLCGISSGGICAFTAAWERPDQFGKVLSHIGSYTNIRGGWAYPGLIRKTKDQPKPIKVYLQEGRDDLNNLHGNWPLANHDMAAALQFAGYHYRFEMTDGGHSGQAAGEVLPSALRWLWSEDSESTHIASTATRPEWQPHPDALPKDDVPHGQVLEMPEWESQIFPGTTRKWAIYVPAQYREDEAAAIMVFQDGERMRDIQGRWRIPVVFDNLIARGEMPTTIAVFIDPGNDPSQPARRGASNRSFEYDSLGDRYSRFLLEEILPEVESRYNISKSPELRAIGGSSSGAICAFTVAWERSDQFGKVYSNVGSFTNLRGGNVYPALLRKTEPKPIRVYMADTSGDIDNAFGSWPWANQRMASALQYMGYDVRFDWAEGYAHNADYGSSRFPDAMRWLWRTEKHTPKLDTQDDLRGDLTLLNLLIPGEGWELVADGLGFADAACSDAEGNFYFSDMKAPAIYRLNAADGSRQIIAKEAVSGMAFGPNGKLYACQGASQQLVAIDTATGQKSLVAANVVPNDLAVTSDGWIYITQTKSQQVSRIHIDSGQVTTVDSGLQRPNGIALTNDGGTLAVSDSGGEVTWTFRVNPDGNLDAKMPTMPMRLP